jgi:HSP20 family protein
LNEKWWRWKKRSEWDEFFREFDKLEKMVDELMNGASDDVSRDQRERKFPNPYVLGFSVSIGPDGKPQVHKFGSLQSTMQGSEVPEEREPLVDVVDDKKEVVIIAELPGVEKEDIKLDVTESTLRISVDTPGRSYYKKLFLPAKVQNSSMKMGYKNGVLEVRLKKTGGKLVSVKNRLSSGN